MSLRKAINAKCKECIYDPIGGGGTWRQQVEACTSYRCPLYPARPTSQPHSGGCDSEKTANLGPEQTTARDA